MTRAFTRHYIRPTRSLDGVWDIEFTAAPAGKERLPETYTGSTTVPSAWETMPGRENYRGGAWMRRRFRTTTGRPVRLVFGGVVHTAEVYVDGRRVGNHYDGFVPWDMVLTGLPPGEHELALGIDNAFGDHSALHIPGDHYSSGGITRPVELQEVPEVFLDKVLATPVRDDGRWGLSVRILIRNVGAASMARRCVVAVAGREIDLGAVTVEGDSEAEIERSLEDLEVDGWNVATPVLYELYVTLYDGDAAVDDIVDRVGFREIRVDGGSLLLNGRPLRLRGYNRHEFHLQFGQSLPVEVIAADLRTLRDLGCNFVRTSHYPNDMRFLDLCDEIGLYIWEETNSTSVSFAHPKYTEQISACAKSMVHWHFNHPCIVIWATLNECDAKTEEGRREHGKMLSLLRELDGSRPVTYASCAWKEDVCLDLPDIVSWNWYEGWYWGGIDTIGPEIDKYLGWQDTESAGNGKPVIISEFGAGALYGYRSPTRVKWTEEFQADVLDELLRVYLNHPRISGAAIWQFNDVRISGQEDWAPRPRCFNNKGTVDELRRRKLSYETVKRRMHEAAEKWDRDGD